MGVTERTKQATEDAIRKLAEGMFLADAVRASGISLTAFQSAISSVRELAFRYAQAREIRADVMADEIVKIADSDLIDPQQAKNMIDVRKWLASKHHSRVYGDRVELTFLASVSASEALAEARARLRPIRDLDQAIDAEIVDTPTLSTSGSPDVTSDDPCPDAPCLADIFK